MSESKEYANGLETNFLQISCQRNATGAQFDKGVQDFNFSVGGNFCFRPDKSYFKFALKLINKAGGQPIAINNMAFADDVVDCLYDNVYFRAGGSDVSSIVNFSPHAGILKRRMNESGAWLNSVGKDAYGLDPSFSSRVNDLASNGVALGVERTISVVAQDSAVTLGIATTGVLTFTGASTVVAADIGQTITVLGVPYTVETWASPTVIGVLPRPPVAVVAAPANVVSLTQTDVSSQKNDKYVMWRPPIGIMDSGALFAGDYRFQLNPSSQYAKRAVESLTNLASDDYTFTVEDVQFFACIERMNAPATGIRKLYLDEMQIQSKTLTNATGSNNLDFSVPPSTKKLIVFVQSSAAGSNNIVPITQFKCLDASDENLKQIQITYANVSKPSTNWTSEYTSGATDRNYITQRYLDSQIATDMINSEGGTESLREWLARGAYVAMDFERDASDRSTHVQLAIQFGNIEANANVFVAAVYSRVAEITTTNGFISSVQTLSV